MPRKPRGAVRPAAAEVLAVCDFPISGDVKWGTQPAPSNTTVVTPGATDMSYHLVPPMPGSWIVIETCYDVNGQQLRGFTNNEFGEPMSEYNRSVSIPAGTFSVVVRMWQGHSEPGTGTWTGTISFTPCNPTNPPPCAYGTELKVGSQLAYFLTPELIQSWLIARGLTFLAPLFTVFWYSSFDASSLCGTGPPAWPSVSLNTLWSSPSEALQLLKTIAWSELCQCKAGTPSPIPYPPPTATEPPGWPPSPTFPCEETDLCAQLAAVRQQLAQLSAAMANVVEATTLLQRYQLPFGYIRGATHSALGAEGTFAISRLIGMEANVISYPPGREQFGNPSYIWDLGWMSISDANGILEERRITRVDQQWFPRLAPTATVFGWALKPQVIVSFVELQAEP